MPLGTKWQVTFETTEPIGDAFIEGIIRDGVGTGEDMEVPIAKSIKIKCLKELTEEEYKKYDAEQATWRKEHGIERGDSF